MSDFTGKDRVKAAFKGEFADSVPAYPILGCYNAGPSGYTIKQYLTDPQALVRASLQSYETFKPDVMVVLADLAMETEALGTPLIFPEDAISQEAKHLLEDKGKLASLSVPDPLRDGRLPYFIQACQEVSAAIKTSPVGGVICGPWTIAIGLRGAEALIFDTMDDPEFIHELMELCTEVSWRMGSAMADARVGFSFSEAPASCSLVSPKIYQTFILPYHKRLVDKFQARRTGITYHICGFIDPTMELILSTGCAGISMDQPSDLGKLMGLAENRSVVIGNVRTMVFVEGTADEVRQEVAACLEAVGRRSGFILSSGCEIPPSAKPENIAAFMSAARELGRYDSA